MSRLKVILVFDKNEKQKYRYHIIGYIQQSEFISLESIILVQEVFSVQYLIAGIKALYYILSGIFSAVERSIYSHRNDPSLNPVAIPLLNITYRRTATRFVMGDEYIRKVSEMNPDIILDLSSSLVLLNSDYIDRHPAEPAKFGIWYFRMSSLAPRHNLLNGFWETATGQGELAGSVCAAGKGGSKVIYSTHSYLHQYSVYNSLRNHYLKLAGAFIHESESFVKSGYRFRRFPETGKEIRVNPGMLFLFNFRLIYSYILRLINATYNRYFVKTWKLIVSGNENGYDMAKINFNSFSELSKPGKTDWADPFTVNHNNRMYLFYEEIKKKLSPKGHLCCAEFDPETNTLINSRVIITENFHLSFPFVFDYHGKYYMIPETMANRTISLYESIEFPYKWKFVKNIFEDTQAADTIIYFHEGLWWLFSTICGRDMVYNYDDLYLFYTRDLFGSWTAHPMNPVVSDVKTARGAGRIFSFDGRLIRPSQCCRHYYGQGLYLNEIRELNTLQYKEEIFRYYDSGDTRYRNIHTFNREGNLMFSDAK